MSQWLVLSKKEWTEMIRNYKILWLPLVFILLGIMQPVTTYYLPTILEKAGNLPDGAVFEIPNPSAPEVLVQTLGQYSQIGVLVLALAFMGIVAGERKSGVTDIIFVKPISFLNYITSKWGSMAILTFGSLLLGMFAAWYYTILLIGDVEFSHFISGVFVYGVWLLFLVTLTLFFSSVLNSSALVACVVLVLAIAISTITSLLSKWMMWSPARLSSHASELILTGEPGENFALALIVTFLLIVVLIGGAILSITRKERG